MNSKFLQKLVVPGTTKIVMLVMDGLGGLPIEPGGKTELETACTPNLDALAARSELGLTLPVGVGVTTGSGPGHMALFGYDPIEYEIERGVLEAMGVGFELGQNDVAARGNFCTVDRAGVLSDRRAGRLATDLSLELIRLLRTIRIDGVEFFIEPVKEHRFALVMRGLGLEDGLSETDPLKTGVAPMKTTALRHDSIRTARVVNEFICQAQQLLSGRQPANMILLRGFSKLPQVPSFQELYRLNPAAIAINGMYRGVARLVGMTLLKVSGDSLADEFTALERNWPDFDFFYIHVKKTDTCGENGDFEGKVRAIEEVDALLPRLLKLEPDVLIVGGDHSSPAVMKSHSWHPVPVLLYSKYARSTGIAEFGERACGRGSLGILPACQLMQIALAHAGRLSKYSA